MNEKKSNIAESLMKFTENLPATTTQEKLQVALLYIVVAIIDIMWNINVIKM